MCWCIGVSLFRSSSLFSPSSLPLAIRKPYVGPALISPSTWEVLAGGRSRAIKFPASCVEMAAKILANLIVMGSGILARAVVQAYRQALTNASKSGVTQETIQNIRRASKTIEIQEARQILGVSEESSWEEIVKRYEVLFERNGASGSFYLQSKVHRAKECLEALQQKKEQSAG